MERQKVMVPQRCCLEAQEKVREWEVVGCHEEFNNRFLGLGELQHYSNSVVNSIKLLNHF